ncbi:MAG: hypothetical protein ACI4DW_01835 [Lachnospiraceae bacterium]
MDSNNMNQPGADQSQNNYQQPAYQPAVDQTQNTYQNTYQNAYQQSAPMYSQQPVYQAPVNDEIVSVGDWMLTMLILCVPCVNIIMMFVWAFSGGTPKSKSNFFKAYLIFAAIGLGIGLLISIIAGGAIFGMLAELA